MSGRILQFGVVFSLLIFLCFPAFSQDHTGDVMRPEPEIGTGTFAHVNSAKGQQYMIVSAHPLATKAGERVLAAGGTAADAAVAVQVMLGLVEPQSSGIGGGAFALYYDAKTGQLSSIDGRETAPKNAGKHLFTDIDGRPMKFKKAVRGGRAVGVPGTMRLLEKLHGWHGKVAWPDLFMDTIHTARNGFSVTPRLAQMVAADKKDLKHYTDTALYFYPDTFNPIRAGDLKQNWDYAKTLTTLAENGADSFNKR